jgi:Fur family peroxide stress response transcriptional regulator
MELGEERSLVADAVLADLKRAGLKLTPQRMAIVRELADDRTHPTAQELFERLKPAFPTMSFATVYNTLDALAKLRLVGSLRLGSAVRFDPNTTPHHHAVCDACGAVVDLPPAPASPAVVRDIQTTSGFEVRIEERTYRGLCGRCASREKERD